jgi:phosphopantothenoylcysteine synthetase/decarboxylase
MTVNVLVTAGNTLALIDRVRCITNVFTGRTGAAIATCARQRRHSVTLVTSHPDTAGGVSECEGWSVRPYRTFEDLRDRLAELIPSGGFDAVVHCAAVSDYLSAGVYSPAQGTTFDDGSGRWLGDAAMIDRLAGKVKSDEEELWVRLRRAPKLVDRIRREWGFRSVLVKFKLEVGLADEALLKVAENSRVQSDADLMVANTLEGASSYAFLGPLQGRYQRVERADLAGRLLEAIEASHAARAL